MAYNALSTANLPNPAIDPAQGSSPQDYFSTVLYSGNSSTQAITGVGFSPNFVWLKSRGAAKSHRLYDSVRGATNELFSDLTLAEGVASSGLTSFDADGFTLGSSAAINQTSDTFVSWNWKANGSGVSNTDGSITSTVSANTESGFSIVKYTGNGTLGATIGHGLGVQPSMVMVKARNVVAGWYVEHKGLTGFGTRTIFLNETSAESAASSHWNNTAPTSSVFTVGNSGGVNQNTKDYIAYCFAEVEGFSKFSSYVGNGNADGPFVYTGFRPAYVVTKRTDASGNSWRLWDKERGFNGNIGYLYPNLSNAEATGEGLLDILSNGFKVRTTSTDQNASGGTYIYMAFAENPFKYSNAR